MLKKPVKYIIHAFILQETWYQHQIKTTEYIYRRHHTYVRHLYVVFSSSPRASSDLWQSNELASSSMSSCGLHQTAHAPASTLRGLWRLAACTRHSVQQTKTHFNTVTAVHRYFEHCTKYTFTVFTQYFLHSPQFSTLSLSSLKITKTSQ